MTAKEFYNTIKENKTLEEIMIEFARIKCLEAIRNTRHKAVDLMIEFDMEHDVYIELYNSIQNIPNQDVMPEL